MEYVLLAIAWAFALIHCVVRRDIDWSTRMIYVAVLIVTAPVGAVIYCLLVLSGHRQARHRGPYDDRPQEDVKDQ